MDAEGRTRMQGVLKEEKRKQVPPVFVCLDWLRIDVGWRLVI